MSSTYGTVAFPLAAPTGTDAVTDKAASILLAYFKAFLNAYGALAWQAVFKSNVATVPTTPVYGSFINDPKDSEFNERDLPALFLWRTGGQLPQGSETEWIGADWMIRTDTWTMLWIFPTAVQGIQQSRDPITAGLAKLVEFAIKRGRAPAYTVSGDSDLTAATVAALPTSIKTSIATSTTAQTYSGAALNGSIGTGSISPPRAPTVTMGGTLSAFVAGSKVYFTGLNSLGTTIVSTVTLGATLGTYTGDYDLSSVTSVAPAAQNSTAGTFTFGTAARTGLGSVVLRHAGLVSLLMTNWKAVKVPIVIGGDSIDASKITRNYDAIEFTFRTEEKLEEDTTDTSALGQAAALGGLDVSFRREDETEIETASLDA